MARKKSGGFGKVLEFIGLVDDEDPRDTYADEYESDNYGKPQAYAPQRGPRMQEQRPQQRQEMSRRYQPSYEPTRAPRMSRGGQAPSRFDAPRGAQPQRGDNRRPAPRNEDRPQRYDYSPRTSRFGSLEDEAPRYNDAPQRNPRNAGGSRIRTVMFSLHATIRKASDRTYLIAPANVEVDETYDVDDRFF